MSAQVDQVSAYLDRGDLKYEQDSDQGIFRLVFEGRHGDLRVLIAVDSGMIQVFCYSPNRVPDSHRTEISLAVHRANYGMKLGNFEFDVDDGEIRYHTTLPLSDEFPDDEMLDHLLYVGVAMVDRYLPAFLAIVYGNEDVKLAIKAAEL